MYLIELPLKVPQSKAKMFSLNLNVYRNADYHSLNNAKHNFTKLTKELLVGVPPLQEIALIYTLFPETKRRLDIMNIGSIVDKFFCDAMVHYGKLPDDNHMHVREVAFRYGEVDASNPRIEVSIFDLIQGVSPVKETPS